LQRAQAEATAQAEARWLRRLRVARGTSWDENGPLEMAKNLEIFGKK